MDQMQKSQYQKACIVICGDMMEDWKYVFRELKWRVSVSAVAIHHSSKIVSFGLVQRIMFRVSLPS